MLHPHGRTRMLGRSAVRRRLALAVACAVFLGGAAISERAVAAAPGFSTKLYAKSDDTLVNPERGFYHQREDCGEVDSDTLAAYRHEEERISLVRCIFYLPRENHIESHAVAVRAGARAARDAGVKLIVRFAYTKTANKDPAQEPNDAPPAMVQSHLAQLAASLRDNSDVILLVESGFVGAFGEGSSSRWFGNIPGTALLPAPTPAQWLARKAIVDRLLEIMPASRAVLVRTPLMKQRMYDEDRDAATPAEIAADPRLARIGYYNDCFLSGGRDADTYLDDVDRDYVAAETRFAPMGGETCNGVKNPVRSDCPNALFELRRYHWSYLNRDYNQLEVLNKWIQQGCMEQVQNRLGYRFRLLSTRSASSVRQGDRLFFRMLIRNTGWAGTVTRRPVYLMLRRIKKPRILLRISLGTTADWKGRSKRIRTCTLPIPAVARVGRYRMSLSLPDPALATNPLFAIRLGNVGLWSDTTGRNSLQRSVTVKPQVATPGGQHARSAIASCTNQKAP
jgi:hypothetical protein